MAPGIAPKIRKNIVIPAEASNPRGHRMSGSPF
jgi:hypothetical protein